MSRLQGREASSRWTLVPAAARLISLLGCTLTLQATPAAAQVRRPVPPSRGAHPAAPPWSEGSGLSPLPLPQTRAIPTWRSHPAVHGRVTEQVVPQRLFPRAADVNVEKRRRAEAMERHPAGKARVARDDGPRREGSPTDAAPPATRPMAGCGDRYRIRSGDTLWAIADASTEADDPAAVVAATRRIYESNRATIGDDPDLILPGQVLSLPDGCDR